MKRYFSHAGLLRLTSIFLPAAFWSLLIFSGCQRNSKKEFKITCIFTNAFPQEIYLREWYTDSLPNVDSAYISDDKRKIIFKGKLDEERLFTLYSKSIHGSHLDIILSDTPVIVYINCNEANWLSSRIEGSYSSDLLQSNIKNTLKYGKARMELRNRIDSLKYTGSSQAIINLEEEKLTDLKEHYLNNEYKTYYNEAMTTHSPILAWWLLSSLQENNGTLKIEPMMSALNQKFRGSSFFQRYSESYIRLADQSVIYDSVPSKITNFILPGYKTGSVSFNKILSNNKYTLVDFWASWCSPCRDELPFLKKAYALYKNKKLQIVSVSLDKNRQQWVNAINKYNMTWPQLIVDSRDSQLIGDYGVTLIPKSLLIDNKGNIIARNLRGKELIATLDSLYDGK